jgi:hypothetical protein
MRFQALLGNEEMIFVPVLYIWILSNCINLLLKTANTCALKLLAKEHYIVSP